MVAWRVRLRGLAHGELSIAAAAAVGTMLLAYAGSHKLGTPGLALPLAVLLAVILMRKPIVMVTLLAGLAILCEGPTFGLFGFTSQLYNQLYKGLTGLDVLVALTVVSVLLEVMRSGRALRVPRPLALGLTLLLLAMIAGAVTGHAAGQSIRSVVLGENVLAYLLFLPIAIANLKLERYQLVRMIMVVGALAMVKAAAGVVEVIGHYGTPVEGRATLTYYEPAANWLIMVVLLTILAAVVIRAKPPRWMLAGTPLLIISLALSYRRSFWIAAVLGVLLVIVLGTSPIGRRMLLPVGLALLVAIWLLGSVGFQSSGSPIVRRAESLAPSKLEANVQDRYRLDERANVLGAIGEHPITGLGLGVPWAATFRPLSVEHEEGREYVHFAALWFWLKLGILGLFAYVAMLAGGAVLAWQAWRRSPEPLSRAFGLGSLCAIAGLLVMDTTASFTGVDHRFTVLFATQLGLLALLVGSKASARDRLS